MDPSSGVAPDQAAGPKRVRSIARTRADQPCHLFLKQKTDYVDTVNQESERERIYTYVTLTKRYRGDHFGFFASDNSGQWIPVNNPGLKKVNVVAPVVRSNNKNWMEASCRLQVTAQNSDPEVSGGADIAQALLDKIIERDWTEQLEEMISELAQLSGAYFLYSRYNKNLGPMLRVPQMARQDFTVPGKFSCATCGSDGPREDAEITGGCPAPGCGAAVTLTDPIVLKNINVPSGYDEQRGGDSETVIYTSYEMKVDERNSKGGDLSKCRWVRNNYLVYRNELEAMRPWAKLDGKGTDWSEGLRQQRALETSAQTGDNLSTDNQANSDRDEDLLDFKRYWFDPKALMGWVCPHDWKFGDEERGFVFEIKAGQTFDEVFLDEEGQPLPFKGLYVERVGDEVLYIGNEDFREHWSVGHWQMDATSFWGKAQEDLLDLQEMRIEMVNIFFQAGMAQSLPVLVIDGMMFDGEDFVNDPGSIVRTRKGYDRGGRPISDFVHQVEPVGPGSEMFGFYNLLVQSTDESSGVAPVSVGQGDPNNKTYGGQQLLAQRAVGLLVPSQKNKARAKREWAFQQLELIQEFYTPDRYVPVESRYGEQWKEADVAAFRKANIREDYRITYAEGSDMPQSLQEREVKLVGLLQSGILQDPTIPLQLKQMLIRMSGVDYDLENYDSEIRVCNARLRRMDRVIKMIEQGGMPYVVDEMGPVVDDYGRPAIDPMAVGQVLNSPGCEIMPESDSIVVHAEFWKDQIMAEAANETPNPFRLAVLRARMIEQASGAAAMQGMGNQLAVDASAPIGEADAGAKDAEFDRQEKGKDADAAREVAKNEAMGPKGPPSVSAPRLSAPA